MSTYVNIRVFKLWDVAPRYIVLCPVMSGYIKLYYVSSSHAMACQGRPGQVVLLQVKCQIYESYIMQGGIMFSNVK